MLKAIWFNFFYFSLRSLHWRWVDGLSGSWCWGCDVDISHWPVCYHQNREKEIINTDKFSGKLLSNTNSCLIIIPDTNAPGRCVYQEIGKTGFQFCSLVRGGHRAVFSQGGRWLNWLSNSFIASHQMITNKTIMNPNCVPRVYFCRPSISAAQ